MGGKVFSELFPDPDYPLGACSSCLRSLWLHFLARPLPRSHRHRGVRSSCLSIPGPRVRPARYNENVRRPDQSYWQEMAPEFPPCRSERFPSLIIQKTQIRGMMRKRAVPRAQELVLHSDDLRDLGRRGRRRHMKQVSEHPCATLNRSGALAIALLLIAREVA